MRSPVNRACLRVFCTERFKKSALIPNWLIVTRVKGKWLHNSEKKREFWEKSFLKIEKIVRIVNIQ